MKYFRVFGSKCYILNDRENPGKFDAKSDEGIFLGYSTIAEHIECTISILRR